MSHWFMHSGPLFEAINSTFCARVAILLKFTQLLHYVFHFGCQVEEC